MGRKYAGFLGSLAFTLSVARGAWNGSSPSGTILFASAAMFAFAAAGFVAGELASYVVADSVRSRMEMELESASQRKTS